MNNSQSSNHSKRSALSTDSEQYDGPDKPEIIKQNYSSEITDLDSSSSDMTKSYDCIIEISQNSDPIKYEFDKSLNMIRVDRMIPVSMSYPCNYGFIPQTLGGDSDPIDVLVMSQYPIIPNAVINIRPIGVLIMRDESGEDEKILAVPGLKIDPYFSSVRDITDVNPMTLEKIKHFFERYKDLEKNKWVKVESFQARFQAIKIIEEAKERFVASNQSINL